MSETTTPIAARAIASVGPEMMTMNTEVSVLATSVGTGKRSWRLTDGGHRRMVHD